MTESGSKFGFRVPLFVGPLVALVLVIALFAVLDYFYSNGQFFTSDNLSNISIQTTVYALAAVGLTVVIISGGIDLSCGTAVTLSATAVAWCILHDVGSRINDGSNVREAAVNVAVLIEEKASEEEVESAKKKLADLIQLKISLLEAQLEPVAKSMEMNDWIDLPSRQIDAMRESNRRMYDRFDRTENQRHHRHLRLVVVGAARGTPDVVGFSRTFVLNLAEEGLHRRFRMVILYLIGN